MRYFPARSAEKDAIGQAMADTVKNWHQQTEPTRKVSAQHNLDLTECQVVREPENSSSIPSLAYD